MKTRTSSLLFFSLIAVCAVLIGTMSSERFSVAHAGGPTPQLLSLNSTALMPGASLTVNGLNLADLSSWKAYVELLTSKETFEVPIIPVSATQFKVAVPNIYYGYNVTAKNAEHRQRIMQLKGIYLKNGSVTSNKLTFNILSPYPIIDSVFRSPTNSGEVLMVTGGNWNVKTIFAYNMSWAMFDYLPGKSVKTGIKPPITAMPLVPVPYAPDVTLTGSFLVQVPGLFCGKTEAEQNTINSATGKFYVYGFMGPSFPSNSFDLQIRKKTPTMLNPYPLILSPKYSPNAPNRTMNYWGVTLLSLPDCQKAQITDVKNTSKYPIVLSGVSIGPNQSTGAFNGQGTNRNWEATGPESGSFLGQYPVISLQISWKVY
jgi:hypothetical protein